MPVALCFALPSSFLMEPVIALLRFTLTTIGCQAARLKRNSAEQFIDFEVNFGEYRKRNGFAAVERERG